tara:strand:+ start:659 stop:829 length:171 start_codon:yes stop_codon:yes gene_type:complete
MTQKERMELLIRVVKMNNQLLGFICKHLFGEEDEKQMPKGMLELMEKFKFEDWGEG